MAAPSTTSASPLLSCSTMRSTRRSRPTTRPARPTCCGRPHPAAMRWLGGASDPGDRRPRRLSGGRPPGRVAARPRHDAAGRTARASSTATSPTSRPKSRPPGARTGPGGSACSLPIPRALAPLFRSELGELTKAAARHNLVRFCRRRESAGPRDVIDSAGALSDGSGGTGSDGSGGNRRGTAMIDANTLRDPDPLQPGPPIGPPGAAS